MFKSEGRDANFIRLIGRFLKTGVIEEGRRYKTDKGTPQGGVLSPILVNVYLHYILDKWFEKEVRRRRGGYSQMIRYADDIIVCFQGKGDAKRYLTWLKQRFSKVGLRIAEEKSKTIEFGRYVWHRAQRKERE
jgi:retron-type reverse transcriptase